MSTMIRLSTLLRSHRRAVRSRRAIAHAIADASTPALRDELVLVAQRHANLR